MSVTRITQIILITRIKAKKGCYQDLNRTAFPASIYYTAIQSINSLTN